MSLQAKLQALHPHTTKPLIVSAPTRPFAQHELAVAATKAGGLGFIASSANDRTELAAAAAALSAAGLPSRPSKPADLQSTQLLPIGIGYLTWMTSLPKALEDLQAHPVQAVWLFAWASDDELRTWLHALDAALPAAAVYVQVGDVAQALAVPALSPSTGNLVLVAQGADAGGHGAARGAGLMTLLPEMRRALRKAGHAAIPVLGAGGVIGAEGAAAALALGADGVVLGSRVVASREARVPEGFRRHIVAARDGGRTTVRTRLFDDLRGTGGFPEYWDGRALVNASVREAASGVPREKLAERYEAAAKSAAERYGTPPALKEGAEVGDGDEYGPDGRLVVYFGSGVGLVDSIDGVGDIVEEVRRGLREVAGGLAERAGA